MSIYVTTVIIGAGQAGLALSHHLTMSNHEHVVLERGEIAQRWRDERWDSFRLLTPNWQARLPGYRYQGADADGFMNKDEIVDFFDEYAASFDVPVHTGVTVNEVRPDGERWIVATDRDTYSAHNVIVATGFMDLPHVPPMAADVPASIAQLHSSTYRNPAALTAGGVLVVGAGPSGQQIAGELARSGRRVVIAAGGHRTLPRRYRGRDAYWWLERLGLLDRTVDTLESTDAPGRTRSSVLAGGTEDLDLRHLVRDGVVPTGRLLGVHGSRATFASDLEQTLADADANRERLRDLVDAYVERTGLDAPVEPRHTPDTPDWVGTAPAGLDLPLAGIGTVVWATGYRRDYSWIDADVFDQDGEVVHRRGVTAAGGLYFLGLRWQHRRNSAFIDGVGADATYLAEHLKTRLASAFASA